MVETNVNLRRKINFRMYNFMLKICLVSMYVEKSKQQFECTQNKPGPSLGGHFYRGTQQVAA